MRVRSLGLVIAQIKEVVSVHVIVAYDTHVAVVFFSAKCLYSTYHSMIWFAGSDFCLSLTCKC